MKTTAFDTIINRSWNARRYEIGAPRNAGFGEESASPADDARNGGMSVRPLADSSRVTELARYSVLPTMAPIRNTNSGVYW